MTTTNIFILLLLIGGFYVSCSSNAGSSENISVIITDNEGKTLPFYGLQLINVNDGWLGTPYKSILGGQDSLVSLFHQTDEPVILRFVAPGYHPKFTFLMPGFDKIDFEVSLKSAAKPVDSSPVAIGNFNNFNSRSGVEMKQDSNGIWKASIETDLDTLRYFVRFNYMVTAPGTNGRIVLNDDSRGISEAFLSEVVRIKEESAVDIQFDAAQYNFGVEETVFNIASDNPANITGVARAYTLMIDEYMNQVFSEISHQLRGKQGLYEHDYDSFLNELELLAESFNHPDVSVAADLARFWFRPEIELSKDEAISLLDNIEADSPLWIINFEALTDALDLAGLKDYKDLLKSIAEISEFKTLRGEALYNLIRYHYQEENKEEWRSTFFEFVSNYPDHFRTGYAYQNYAPEQPIAEGKALPHNEFNLLDEDGTMNLHDIEESYLLIDFWATWCGPCIAAMPKLHELHENYKDSDFAIVSISVDEVPERVHSFRNKWEMPWYNGHQKQSSQVIKELGIIGIPHYILLGPDRTVISNDQTKLRGKDFSKIIDNYLNNN